MKLNCIYELCIFNQKRKCILETPPFINTLAMCNMRKSITIDKADLHVRKNVQYFMWQLEQEKKLLAHEQHERELAELRATYGSTHGEYTSLAHELLDIHHHPATQIINVSDSPLP